MLKAKLDSARKNKKGFSLVELIIVMAIMVALVAVMAPQFIKYVQRSRDAVVTDACENCLSCIKTEIALGHITYTADSTKNVITISTDATSGKIKFEVTADGLGVGTGAEYTTLDSTGTNSFAKDFCGIDFNKSTKTDVKGTIVVDSNGVATLSYVNAAK